MFTSQKGNGIPKSSKKIPKKKNEVKEEWNIYQRRKKIEQQLHNEYHHQDTIAHTHSHTHRYSRRHSFV